MLILNDGCVLSHLAREQLHTMVLQLGDDHQNLLKAKTLQSFKRVAQIAEVFGLSSEKRWNLFESGYHFHGEKVSYVVKKA